MGAGQAMQTGLGHLELFAWIGAFSGGVLADFDPQKSFGGALADIAAANKKIKLLWIGYGELDGRYSTGKAMHAAMEKAGVRHVWFEGPGSHEWQVWRKHLRDFAPRLFR
jgi:enterochelin esterase family protein